MSAPISTIAELSDDLERAYAGDPWHGPPLSRLLAGLDRDAAMSHPIAGAHSIWELVLHLAAWTREAARRHRGATPALPAEGDWPSVPPLATENDWMWAVTDLRSAHADALSALAYFPVEKLGERVGTTDDPVLGAGQTYAGMVRG